MEKELIGPTATLAAAILAKVSPMHGDVFEREVITSAFEEAYFALQEGITRVDEELARRSKSPKSFVDFG